MIYNLSITNQFLTTLVDINLTPLFLREYANLQFWGLTVIGKPQPKILGRGISKHIWKCMTCSHDISTHHAVLFQLEQKFMIWIFLNTRCITLHLGFFVMIWWYSTYHEGFEIKIHWLEKRIRHEHIFLFQMFTPSTFGNTGSGFGGFGLTSTTPASANPMKDFEVNMKWKIEFHGGYVRADLYDS